MTINEVSLITLSMKHVLDEFRAGLGGDTPAFTLKEVSEATGIPYTTLQEMKKADYAENVFARFEALRRGLEKLSKKQRRA